MNRIIPFLFLLSVVLAADIDWSNVQTRDLTANISNFLQFRWTKHGGRITGGSESPRNAFPHQVGLILEVAAGNAFCGGSLISNQWVLTAAHCTDGAKSATVYLGAHYIREEESDRLEVKVGVENIIIHAEWDSSMIYNDISLIKLPQPVAFSKTIQPIKLARQADKERTFEDEPAVATGWGKDSDEATAISPVLRYIETNIYSFAICKILFLWRPIESQICITGSNGASTCNGDSGGPLITFEADGTPILIGATSYGSGLGCEKGFPAVFTRITSFLDWIHDNTGIELR